METTAFSSPSHVADAQRLIESEIQGHHESIRALKSQRNSLSMINRLPPEVLSRVFMFCIAPPSMRWIAQISHVSRHWRTIAISCPNLWNHPRFSYSRCSSQRAMEMVKRSKNVPLVLRGNLSDMHWESQQTLKKLVLEHIGKVAVLDVSSISAEFLQNLAKRTESAPYLHTLHLRAGLDYQTYSQSYELPSTFLSGYAPHLESLSLENMHLSLDSTLLGSSLVHLELKNVHLDHSSLIALASALARTPLLERLELLGRFNGDPSNNRYTSRRIPLAKLQYLHLRNASGPQLGILTLLERLSIRHGARWKLRCSCEDNDVPLLSSLLENLPVVVPIRSLSIASYNGILTVIPDFDVPTQTADRVFELQLLKVAPHWKPEFIMLVCRSIPLQSLAYLRLSGSLSTKACVRAFGDLPSLRTIEAYDQSVAELIAALDEDVILDGTKQFPQLPAVRLDAGRRTSLRRPKPEVLIGGLFFPVLKSLSVEGADFSEQPSLDMLLTSLMARCNRSQELEQFKIQGCWGLSTDDVMELEKIVVDVQWDGSQRGPRCGCGGYHLY
uniref:F-box domain-containing protein n=1 Tax=Mycena chlorophos TaxID=658473 RepID=A0ABQ0L853_MYCCL|nr:predicted protein [Mycena chlorophos]